MPDIPAASPVSPASTATTTGGNNIVVETAVNNVPDKIAQLARQIEVSGTLANLPAGGSVTLNTVIGPLVLMLPQLAQAQQDKLLQQLITLFQNQRPLTVVLQPGNPPSQAFLLLPPASQATQYQSSAANFLQSSFQTSSPAQNAPPLLPNLVLSAVVLPRGVAIPVAPGQFGSSPYNIPNPAAGFSTIPAGANAGVISAADFVPPDALVAEEEFAKLGQQVPGALPQAATLPNQPVVPNALALDEPNVSAGISLQPGAELTLRIGAVITLPEQGAPAVPPPVLQNNQIIATVTGNAPGGQAILKAGDATLFVRQPVDAPVGTQLVLTVEPARTGVAAYVTASDPQFAALQQIMSALAQADPAAAHQIFASRLPQPGEALPGALLFFLSVIRQGDVRNWLGNGALDMLARIGKAELVAKFAQELQQAAQTSRDTMVGEWKTYSVPLQDHNQLTTLYFHVHGERRQHQGSGKNEGDAQQPGPTQMRFLIDVRMSRLGSLQLDGFLRPRQLDMIVRSEYALPPWLNQELRESYGKTMNAIGYIGSIGFQSGRHGWLNVQRPAVGREMVT